MSFRLNRNFLSCLLILLSLFGCHKQLSETPEDVCLALLNDNCINKSIKIKMYTSKGEVIIELNGELAPLTASNFLLLVEKGLYQGTIFNRVISSPYPFILQGGYKDLSYYLDSNIKSKDESYINKGNLGLTKIPLEIKLKGEDKPRYNSLISKYDDFNRIQLTHRRGALAMARAQLLNSASIQFYISLKDLPELDGRYAVFGRVVDGMNVIDSLNEGDLILNMKVIKN